MALLGELKKRNVFKVAAAYAILAWLLIQVAAVLLPTFEAPQWVLRTVTFMLILGFPLAVGLAWAFQVTPEGIKRTPLADAAEAGLQPLQSPAAKAIAGAPSALTQPPLANSIAVLPFANISPNPDDAYFAVGIHEEILNQLAKLSALHVVARTTVLQYGKHQKSIPEIAEELNVESVKEGSVRFAGGRVRITTQLIAASSGMHLWSETYEREFQDIFAIESDVAIQVAKALRAEFSWTSSADSNANLLSRPRPMPCTFRRSALRPSRRKRRHCIRCSTAPCKSILNSPSRMPRKPHCMPIPW